MSIPRIVNANCLHGMLRNATQQPSFWCSVLRGRVPVLLVLHQKNVPGFVRDVFMDAESELEHKACLAAVITGEMESLPNAPNLFSAYSYMCERFIVDETPLFAWPLFMVAQNSILRIDYGLLRATLENPSIDEPKAFEAAVELPVLVRLLSEQEHHFVPMHPELSGSQISAFKGTEFFHVSESAGQVSARFHYSPEVLQVVAVPLFAFFPSYDFFVLHRELEEWKVVVGYQCKQGAENPTEDALAEIPLSVWIEGKCRKFCVQKDGKRVPEKRHRGWVLLGEENQASFLGISVAEALPLDPISDENPCGMAEKALNKQQEAAAAKKARTD